MPGNRQPFSAKPPAPAVPKPASKPLSVVPSGVDPELVQPGPGGYERAKFLSETVNRGRAVMFDVAASAVARLINTRQKTTNGVLYTPEERGRLVQALGAPMALADLVGRARILTQAGHSVRIHARSTFAVGEWFARNIREAYNFFKALTPALGIQPDRYGELMERDAFTMCVASEQTLLQRVQGIITRYLGTDWNPVTNRETLPLGANAPLIRKTLIEANVEPLHPQYCFLPGTRVEGAVQGASKAWYDGPAVKIETDDGRILSVTINHPVLTTAGWKRAGDLKHGDQAVCYGNRIETFADNSAPTVFAHPERWAVNNNGTPPRIEDVFETLATQRSTRHNVQRPASALDFYGDAAFFPSKIHSVWPDRELMLCQEPQRTEAIKQIAFVMRGNVAAKAPCHCRGLSCFAGVGMLQSALTGNKVSENFGFPLGRHGSPEVAHRIGTAANLDSSLFKTTEKRFGGDIQLCRNLVSGLPGKVSLRRVVGIERIWWAGHVYDLQTEHGFIVSQGILTANCDMVFRTNVLDALNTGSQRQVAGMEENFPVWQYLGIKDGREGDDHRPMFNRYYPSSVTFAEVRGPRPYNCRCCPRWIHKTEWARLVDAGAKLETNYSLWALAA